MGIERLIARIAFEGACESFKHSVERLDLSNVKEINLKVELENGEYCTVSNTGKQIAENIRQYHARLSLQMKMRPLKFWARLKYLFTGKM